ncbi:MAG: tRNA (guanine-N(7)-)-methyltransferase [Candidatus Binatia bacterium]|nr:MAG: tRNA (guanine-N(7)-)-methyltransferase [Candidatus Binatia bacterium]
MGGVTFAENELWHAVFGNSNPVEVEIGPERGTFLLAAAAARPDRNYVGIERSASRVRRIESRLEREPRPNVRVVQGDAFFVLEHCIPPESVSAFHLYFPDPWWKRRHHRRRVTTPRFASLLVRALRSGGTVHFATDVEETFRLGCTSFEATGRLERVSDRCPRPVVTAYERKALARGRPIFEATYRKKEA